MYIYEYHLGGIFLSNEELSADELYCDQCGDSDCLIGEADTRDEAEELLLYEGWDIDQVNTILNQYFGK